MRALGVESMFQISYIDVTYKGHTPFVYYIHYKILYK